MDRRTYVQMDVPTDGQIFPPLMLLGQLGGADLRTVVCTCVVYVVGVSK